MDERKFHTGMLVRITGDLVETYGRYGRSSNGEMERMKGNVYPVKHVKSQARILIAESEDGFGYTFHPEDLTIVSDIEVKEPDPIIFEFDSRHLDI